ncbi:MAG: hypothetical protein WCQ21_30040, partial [Verrucomicrobiota bacterium]
MEGYIILILLLVAAPIALAIWLIARAVGARQSIDDLLQRLRLLEREVARLKGASAQAPAAAPVTAEMPKVAASVAAEAVRAPVAAAPAQPAHRQIPREPIIATPAPTPIAAPTTPISAPPPVIGPKPPPRPAPEPARPLVPAINWEQFMGVKLLAWVGGLAAFLAVAFLVK